MELLDRRIRRSSTAIQIKVRLSERMLFLR